jgi:HAMP domain-containing protein
VDTKVVVLTKSMTYAQKRDTLYSYMVIDAYDAQRAAKIRELFDAAHEYNALRNNIAHALWKPGARPNSVRPWYLDLRQGKGKIAGMDIDEKDYTMDELGAAANALRRITNQIIRFLRESGIAPAIAEKIERINSPSIENTSAIDVIVDPH